jgi:GH15 family glucan-1,4-alpha-glucosidase
MERLPVVSSVLHSVGYDGSTSTLEVEFENGSVYEYRDVAEDIYAALMSSDSKGHYFDSVIRPRYDCTRLL